MRHGSLHEQNVRSVGAGLFVVLMAWAAQGDVLYLHNGDRLSGVLEGACDGTLTFTTEYAGELRIDLDSVQALVTDGTIAVRLEGGEIQEGRLAVDNGAQVFLTENGDSSVRQSTFSISQVDAIAPDAKSLSMPLAPEEAEATGEKKWSGALDAGISLRSGYTDTLDGNLGLTFIRKRTRDTLTLELTGGYSEVDSEVNTRRVKGSGKWQYYPRERLYVFGHSALEHDPGRRLELRFETGGGLGYDFIKAQRRALALEIGLDYAREHWNEFTIKKLEDAKRDARNAARTGLRSYIAGQSTKPPALWTFEDLLTALRLTAAALDGVEQETREADHVYLRLGGNYTQTLFKQSNLSEKLTLLPKLTDVGEYRLASEFAFDTPLSDQLSFRLSLKTEYDSDTGKGDDEFTNTFISALRYSF